MKGLLGSTSNLSQLTIYTKSENSGAYLVEENESIVLSWIFLRLFNDHFDELSITLEIGRRVSDCIP